MTSSDVVGSSAMISCDVERQRQPDHDALPHAAAELVRIVAQAPRRDAQAIHQLDDALASLLPGYFAVVHLDRFDQVVLDALQWIE